MLLKREICACTGFTGPSVTVHRRKTLGLNCIRSSNHSTWKIFGTSCEAAQVCLPKKNGLRILEALTHIKLISLSLGTESPDPARRSRRSSARDLGKQMQSLPTKPSRGLGHDALGKSKSSKTSTWLIVLRGPSQLNQDTV